MSIQSTNGSEMVVLAKYKVSKKGKYDTKFSIRFDLMLKGLDMTFSNLLRFLLKYISKEVEIEKEEKHYTKIFSITENGVEKLEEMPHNIVLFISTEDKNV